MPVEGDSALEIQLNTVLNLFSAAENLPDDQAEGLESAAIAILGGMTSQVRELHRELTIANQRVQTQTELLDAMRKEIAELKDR